LSLAGVRALAPDTRNQRFACRGESRTEHMLDSGMSPDDKTYSMSLTEAPACSVPIDHDVMRPANRSWAPAQCGARCANQSRMNVE
jgi:hypothetical protein